MCVYMCKRVRVCVCVGLRVTVSLMARHSHAGLWGWEHLCLDNITCTVGGVKSPDRKNHLRGVSGCLSANSTISFRLELFHYWLASYTPQAVCPQEEEECAAQAGRRL